MKKRDLQEKIAVLDKETQGLKRRILQPLDYDESTGLYKRLPFERFLEKEVYRAKRYRRVFSLVIVRLKTSSEDQMKRASSLLKLKNRFREIDLYCRFSKRSFGLILPETSHPRALIVGERIKAQIEKSLGEKVRVSIGVATYPYGANTKDGLLREARRSLGLL